MQSIMPMQIKIKRLHPDAVIPSYAHDGDAGLDITAVSRHIDNDGNIVYRTGISIEIPMGYYGQIQPRSSVTKKDLTLLNTPAIIDSNFRGEILIKFRPALQFQSYAYEDELDVISGNRIYEVGDRIAQLIILSYPKISFTEVDELSDSERGTGGYGSSGR